MPDEGSFCRFSCTCLTRIENSSFTLLNKDYVDEPFSIYPVKCCSECYFARTHSLMHAFHLFKLSEKRNPDDRVAFDVISLQKCWTKKRIERWGRKRLVSRQRCERQKYERHQCEARSANANSANETTVRMRQKCEGQVCEGQELECECDFSANGQSSEVIQIVRSRSLCLPSRWSLV